MNRLYKLGYLIFTSIFLLCPVVLLAQNKFDTTEFTKAYSDKFKSNFFFGAGLHINSISPSKTSPYYAAGGRAYTSILPEISFGTNLFTDPATARVVFRLELSLTGSRYRANYQNQIEPYIAIRSNFDQLSYVFIPQVLYNFYNTDDLKFYLGLGVAFEFSKYTNVYYGPQNPAQSNATYNSNIYDLNNFDDTVMLKAGVQIGQHWGIFANYLAKTYTTQVGYFSLTSNCKQVGVNYFFY